MRMSSPFETMLLARFFLSPFLIRQRRKFNRLENSTFKRPQRWRQNWPPLCKFEFGAFHSPLSSILLRLSADLGSPMILLCPFQSRLFISVSGLVAFYDQGAAAGPLFRLFQRPLPTSDAQIFICRQRPLLLLLLSPFSPGLCGTESRSYVL